MNSRQTFFGLAGVALILISGASFRDRLRAQPDPPADTAPPPAPPPAAVLKTPVDLFEDIARETRAQWRQQYRVNVETSVPSRQKAALGLGAIMSDLYLSGMARDTQHIRNLAQDQEALEKTLGIHGKMTGHRQKIISSADSSDWDATFRAITIALERQDHLLKEQRDDILADLIHLGKWLRAWQITTAVVEQRKLEKDVLAIGDTTLISAASLRAEAAGLRAGEEAKCLKLIARKLGYLEKLWRSPTPEGRAERLRATRESLVEIIDPWIQNQPLQKVEQGAAPPAPPTPPPASPKESRP